jgi:penicillin-binding protein 2
MQVARYTSLIATGNLVTPKLASVVDNNKTKNEIVPIEFDKYIHEVRQGMYDVCNVPGGTAYRVMHNLPIVAAGKTGTSQVTSIPQSTVHRLKEHELAYFHRSHAWITTYAPYNDPQFVVTVLIEHGGHGGSTSAPMAADIYRWLFAHGYFKKKPAEDEIKSINDEIEKKIAKHSNANPLAPDVTAVTNIKKRVEKVKKVEKKKIHTSSSLDMF